MRRSRVIRLRIASLALALAVALVGAGVAAAQTDNTTTTSTSTSTTMPLELHTVIDCIAGYVPASDGSLTCVPGPAAAPLQAQPRYTG
jgi:hypothetical protein